ncbi:g11517 [Coccomyxa elongata]
MEKPRIGRLRAPVLLALVLAACASTAVNGALSDACTASVADLFPPQFNLSSIKADLDSSPPDVRAVVPSPLVGFTLFVASNAALDSLNGGSSNNRAVAARLQSGVETIKAVSFWLYNMLSQPLSSDQLLLEKSAATQLSSVTNSSRYDLRFATPDSLRSSEVMVAGLLDNPARIVSSFQVCTSWVHVVDAILWPASSPDPAAIPDPAAGGSFPAGQPQILPTAQLLWELWGLPSLRLPAASPLASFPARSLIDLPPLPDLARSPTAGVAAIPQATGIALPPALDENNPYNPPNPQRALNIAVSAISNGINSAINTVQNSGNMQAPPQQPAVAPISVPTPAPLGAFLGSQASSAAAPGGGSGNGGGNVGAIVGGVVGGVVGLAIVAAALAAWLVMRKRRIRNSGSSDEESPHMKGGGFGVAKRFPNGRSLDGGKDGVIKDSASSTVSGEIGMQPYIRRSGTDDSGFLMLDNDTEYFVEPRYVMSGASSWRERDGESSSLWRTRTSLGTAMGGEADWEIMPEDIVICKDPYGRDWQLGTGGFGSVYKGIWQGNTPVAVKFVTGHSPKEQQRFRNEVAILKSLRHVNIVQFLGASLAGDQIMLVTEYMPRGDLWRALSQDSTHHFSWRNMGWQVALHIARGLHHMHSRKVMHLDLKSANILLARDGTAKVADVGLAKILTRDNTHVSMEGTFDWAAPEVLAGQECSEKADIWSMGVVLWEIVTGERPHLRQLRPLRVPEECPAEIEQAINACRQLDPAARPSALDICNVIEQTAPRQSSDSSSLPPGSLPAELSCSFPTRDNTEPPTSDDLAYVPMSSFGPESSLSPPTTSGLQHSQANGQVPELAFPSPFAAPAAHQGPQRPGTAPSAFSAAAAEDAESRRTASTSAIAASPFANSAFAPAEDGRSSGLERASSPALGSGVTAQTVADGLPSTPSAPLGGRDGIGAAAAAAADGGRRRASGQQASVSQGYPHSATSSPSVSGILTHLPHRGGQAGALRPPLGESPRSVSTPRELGVFASHPIPEEADLAAAEDDGGGKGLGHLAGGKSSTASRAAGGLSVQAR